MPAVDGLLDQLEAGPPRDDEAGLGDRLAGQEPGAGDLVDGVVATDVLAHDEQLAVGRRQPGRVHAAGAGEDLLALAQQVGEPAYDVERGQRRRSTAAARGTSRTAAIESLPQTPHAEPAPKPPVPVCRWVGSTRGGADSVSVTTLNSCSAVRSASVQ